MYLIGHNTPIFPWIIPKHFPRDALPKQDREKLSNFIDDYNSKLAYTKYEKWLITFISILYPPIAQYINHRYFR